MSTATTSHTTTHRRTILTALVAAGTLATLTACGSTTESVAGSPPPTIAVGTTAPIVSDPLPTTPAPAPAPTPAPAPAPAPPPPPAPAPAPTPPPEPEPVEVPLLSTIRWNFDASEPDGAGGSAEVKQVGTSGVGLRAYAWHGYNGYGGARATASTEFDASQYLTDAIPVARVEVQYSASGSGVLKAPWDRSAEIQIAAGAYGPFSEDEAIRRSPEGLQFGLVFLNESLTREAEISSELSYPFRDGTSHRFLVTPERPVVGFSFRASCEARGGPMAVALFHEGYCDFYEKGGVQLDSLSVVVTPLPDYDIVDGTPTPRE